MDRRRRPEGTRPKHDPKYIKHTARNPLAGKEDPMTTTDSPDAGATVRGDEGASVLGPDNVAVALQNPGAAATDSGSLPNLKFPFPAAPLLT